MIQLLQFVLGAKIEIKNLVCIIKIRICNFPRENSTPESFRPSSGLLFFSLFFRVVINIFLQKTSAFFTILPIIYLFTISDRFLKKKKHLIEQVSIPKV